MHKQFARLNRYFRGRYSRACRRNFRRSIAFQQLESRCMLIGSDWTNGLSPLNVDNDFSISPLDVLQIVNELNNEILSDPLTGKLPAVSGAGVAPPPYLDVDCDQFVTPLDALIVINHLNGHVTPIGQAYTRSDGTSGNFSSLGCGAILHEGSSFVSSMTTQLTIPADAAALSFLLEGIEFDTSSQGAIHDAFEAALLDLSGRPLVHPIGTGRDAFYNSTENATQFGSSEVVISGNRVTLSLEDVLPGTQANLVFRLINNDDDSQTAAAIRSVQFETLFSGGPGNAIPQPNDGPRSPVLTSGVLAVNSINVPANTLIESPSNGSRFEAGSEVLVSGRLPIGVGLSTLSHVTVAGRPVDALDAAGNFFTRVVIQPGENVFEFTATDVQGQSIRSILTLAGFQPVSGAIDLSQLSDVSSSFEEEYGRTSFDGDSDVLYADLKLRNAGQYLVNAPLLVSVQNISDPSVRIRDFDGVTPDGIPFYDFTSFVADGTLLPGESSAMRSISFFVPKRTQFNYDLVILAGVNQAPRITTVPIVEVIGGSPYVYDVDAIDSKEDSLAFSLLTAPEGMSLDAGTGRIVWSPSSQDIGEQTVIVQVVDGRGGSARQRFELSVIEPPPNRPPVFASLPLVSAAVDVLYQYTATAVDPDGDGLSFALDVATQAIPVKNPSFEAQVLADDLFTIGTLTDWTLTNGTFAGATNPGPTQYPNGLAPDGQNIAYSNDPTISQVLSDPLRPNTRYVLTVAVGHRLDNTLNAFVIQLRAGGQVLASSSTPIPAKGTFSDVSIVFESPIEHPMLGQSLEIRLAGSTGVNFDNVRLTATEIFAPPSGMTIDATTGVIAWTPTVDQIGTHEIRVLASDGRGGTATQAYSIRVAPDPSNHSPMIISEPVPSVLILPVPTNRSNLTIDFEGLPAAPSFIGGSQVPPEARLFDQLLATHGVVFQSGNGVPFVAVVRLGVGHATSGSNGIGGMGSATILQYEKPVIAEFFLPSDPSIPALTDFVTVKVERQGAMGTVVMQGFGVDGVLLESTSAIDNGFAVLTLSTPGIHKVVIQGTSTTGYDDFSFKEVYPAQIYEYEARAVDPDGDTLTYSLTAAPLGMTIDSSTGKIRWPVASLNVGTPLVTVRVDDGRNGFDSQNLVVAPTITPAKVSGTVFNDQNGDGVRDAGENGLQGRIVYLDLSRNYRRDPGEDFAITDASGNYEFDNLAPGRYIVREEQQTGSRLASPTRGALEISLADGQSVSEQNFGNSQTITANSPPSFSTLPSLVASVGEEFHYVAVASDADLDPLLFDLLVGPEGMIVDPKTGVVVWTPAEDQARAHDVIVRVSDGRGGVDLQSFTVRTSAAQTAPVFTTPTPQASSVVNRSYEYQFRAQDAENDPLVYRLEQSASGMSLNPASGLFTWTPAADQLGDHTVNVVVDDGRGGQDALTFTLEVLAANANATPIIRSTPRTQTQLGRRYLYAIEADDADNDSVDFTLIKAPAGIVFDQNTRFIEWFPSPDQLGNNEVEIHVEDGHGGSAVQSFVINVAATVFNEVPEIVSSPTVVGTIGKDYGYDLRVTDRDGDPLVWSLSKAPRGMSIDALLGTIRWTPADDQIGLADVEVLVTDAQGGTATQSFTITVRAINVSPNISSVPPTRGTTGQIYNYAVRASDVDGDSLSYSFLRAPSGMTINAATGLVQWTPSGLQVGSHDVTVLVEDGRGGQATQIYTVKIAAAPINHPPVIQSIPGFVGAVGVAYQYDVNAKDVDGDSLAFELLAAPLGMTIDAVSGLVNWTPEASQFGNHRVIVAVNDGASIAAQRFTLNVESTNRPPIIHSTPVQSITPGLVFRYDLNASDPDGNALTYSLTSSPAGMSIDSLGRIAWATSTADIGTHSIAVQVSDPFGAVASQSFDLIVSPDTEAPRVFVEISHSPADLGSEVTFLVSATDDVGVESLVLFVNGQPLPLDRNGMALFQASAVGTFEVVATATDAAGNIETVSTSLLVVGIQDENAPEVAITSPSDEAVITRPVDIIGTSTDESLLFYKIEVAVLGTTEFTEIARGSTAVSDGVLGTFDPTLLQNDTYVLRLTAVDTGGKSALVEQIIHVEGNLKLGNFTLSFTDMTVPVFGVPITVGRTYDTLAASSASDFGYGWRLEYRSMDLRTSVAPSGMEEFNIFNPFKIGSRVYVTLPGGERQGFTFKPEVASGFRGAFLGIFEPHFVPDAGVKSSLTVNPADLRISSDGRIFDYATGSPYNPTSSAFGGSFLLTTKAGISYDIDGLTGQLTKLIDSNDNVLTFSDGGITGPEGINVLFERDPQGRITSVVDPAGQRLQYQYDARGDLIAVTNRTNHTTEFVYRSDRPHYLDQVIDALGNTGVRTEYDAQGRLTKLIDAANNVTQLAYDPSNLVSTVTDALHHKTTEVYDARGNTLTHIDALGGITRRTFDVDNNKLTETDPLGRTTTFTYDDRGSVLSETNPLGDTKFSTYQAFTFGTTTDAAVRGEAAPPFVRVKTSTDPLGNTVHVDYDAKGNAIAQTDALGNTTTTLYDKAGNPIASSDPLGNVTKNSYASGNRTKMVDPNGHVTNYSNDATGNILSQTQQDGSGWSLAYNANGQPTSLGVNGLPRTLQYDGRDQITQLSKPSGPLATLSYDELGQVTRVTLPDGTDAQTSTYDAVGNLIAQSDILGNVTRYSYDAVHRLVQTTFPDGSTEDRTYNLAGELVELTNELGNSTKYVYDGAGRQSQIIDALGGIVATQWDSANRIVAMTDALGRISRFQYDANGRQVATIWPDGSVTRNVYDAAGRLAQTIDPEGHATTRGYDSSSNLISVTDALGNVTKYEYGENNERLAILDARGNITRFLYDTQGHLIQTTQPNGDTDRATYDSSGRLASTMDGNGQTISYNYDARDRLISRTLPDGSEENYTYTIDGLISSITDVQGTTQYDYDPLMRRLVRVTDPFGAQASYAYDAAGNRTSLTAKVGSQSLTTHFTFDTLNRLASVTAPDLGVTRYTYDAVGNLIRTELPNGTVETRSVDDMNRIVFLEHRNSSGVISSQQYTLTLTGQRASVVEQNGRRVDYTYDALDRLTREAITDALLGDRSFDYTYDAVGNRLSRNDSETGLTQYSYDTNDRLITEVAGSVTTQLNYDRNGNLLSRVSDTDRFFYEWDAHNRLIAADTDGDGTIDVRNRYDVKGIRISETIEDQEKRFLIDSLQPNAQVLLEYLPSGLIEASYVRGNGLISQTRNGMLSVYHADGLGSTRALTNADGAILNQYVYDAFGRMIHQSGGTDNSYQFAGEQRDAALGLDYLRARYYDPSTGRFVSRDAFPGLVEFPLTLNKYAYAQSNPVNLTDPSGMFTLTELEVAQAIQAEGQIKNAVNTGRAIDRAVQTAFKILQGVGAAMTAMTAVEGVFEPAKIGHFFGGISYGGLFGDLEDAALAVRSVPMLAKMAFSMTKSNVNYIFEPQSPFSDAYAWVFSRLDQNTVFYAPPFLTLNAFPPPTSPLRNCMVGVLVHEFAHLASKGDITDIRGRNSYGIVSLQFPAHEALKNAENYMLAVQATLAGLDAEQARFNPTFW